MGGGIPQDQREHRYVAPLAGQAADLAGRAADLAGRAADPGTELDCALLPYHPADWAQDTTCLRE
jgi:hypothetical protein